MQPASRNASIVICGAGILGLFIAKELADRGVSDILMVDKETETGRHASGRNSGVLHAGIYYAPDGLKAKFCVDGNHSMRAYCEEYGLPMSMDGKVIVAADASQLPLLDNLYGRAQANGAAVAMIDKKELADIEPNARTVERAIHSPHTAVVEPKSILQHLRQSLAADGRVSFAFGERVHGPKSKGVLAADGGDIAYEKLINTAGAHADTLAHQFGIGRRYRLVPFKGLYRKLKKDHADYVRGSIYPVPDPRNPFLGVHFTRSVHKDVYLGPTAMPALGRENYGVLSGVDVEAPSILLRDARLFFTNPKFRTVALAEPRKYFSHFFFQDASRLVKHLDPGWVEKSPKVGIRAQLVDIEDNELMMDFLVERDETSVHVLNAVSPAFTCAPAFARHVVEEYIE